MSEAQGTAGASAKADKHDKAGRHWTGAHTTHRLRYHLVFVPKYRESVLEGPVAMRLRELLAEACEVNGWEALELAVQPDHVHLLVQVQPRYSVPAVVKVFMVKVFMVKVFMVKVLKGGTSRVLRAEFPELAEFLWGSSFWAVGYFAVTVGVVEGEAVARYIREQREM